MCHSSLGFGGSIWLRSSWIHCGFADGNRAADSVAPKSSALRLVDDLHELLHPSTAAETNGRRGS